MKSIPIIRDRLFSIFKHRLKDPSFQRLKLTERTTEVVSVYKTHQVDVGTNARIEIKF